MFLHVRAASAGTEADLLAAIRREIRAYDPHLPVLEATTMHAFHDRSIELWAVQAGGRMFLVFGLLALLLAVVGLYGVKSYIVSQRTREIGIRMALGARPGDVLSMMLKEGAALAAVGVALGLPLAALFVSQTMTNAVQHDADRSGDVRVGGGHAGGGGACRRLPPRATRVDPIVALRAE
jgi:ABC-type antimicrobial peptide transport system permease subunit